MMQVRSILALVALLEMEGMKERGKSCSRKQMMHSPLLPAPLRRRRFLVLLRKMGGVAHVARRALISLLLRYSEEGKKNFRPLLLARVSPQNIVRPHSAFAAAPARLRVNE